MSVASNSVVARLTQSPAAVLAVMSADAGATKATDDRKAEVLVHWVAQNIRYSGQTMGEGEGFTLHPANMIFEQRSGVCKDIAGMLIVFTALVALANHLLADWIGAPLGLNAWIAETTGGVYQTFSLEFIAGMICAPVAWLIGIDPGHLMVSGQLLGTRTVLNEFISYLQLGQMKSAGTFTDERALIILTYALCGFANIVSIGIQVGGIGALAPEKRGDLARLGGRALLGGSLACFLTACVAGMMI